MSSSIYLVKIEDGYESVYYSSYCKLFVSYEDAIKWVLEMVNDFFGSNITNTNDLEDVIEDLLEKKRDDDDYYEQIKFEFSINKYELYDKNNKPVEITYLK